ncbi:MAG: NAD(P)H-hydrate dehydratase [Nitrososphaerales archaeon]|jgi:NAD(P)H-hydrate epimerase
MDTIRIDKEYVAARIPPRKSDSHKGMNGRAAVVGGSRIYHGAPFHAAMAALRTGLDIVYLAVPAAIATPVRAMSPDLIVIPLPDSKLTRGNANKLVSWLPALDCIGVGPGLGPQNPDELAYALTKFSTKSKTLVADADALRSSIIEVAKKVPMVVTPHYGEFERLFSAKVEGDLEARVRLVSEKARESGMTVLLKGPVDIVSDGEDVGLNATHTPAMTTAGTGDVLTGVVTGLCAKGIPAFEAACCAAYINGAAGVEASKRVGLHMVASDLVEEIPSVMREFDRIEGSSE